MYETLMRWRQRAGPAASLSVLEQCLRDLDLNRLADQITRTAMSPTRSGREIQEGARGAVGGQLPVGNQSRYPSVTVDRRFPIVEFERLQFQSFLGRGGFAYVTKYRHLDWRQDVAVKCLLTRQIEGSEQEVLYSEARKLNLGSRSDHVISLLGVCLDPNFAIVMPYMENGSLAELLRDVDVPWALRWRMAHEISLGMTFLHCQNPQILHCDLKAENVLLDGDFHVKISDFGLSKWRTKSRVVTATSPVGGTITHAPPEYFLDINVVPAAEFDVYSFGVLLWEIITRTDPYGIGILRCSRLNTIVSNSFGSRPLYSRLSYHASFDSRVVSLSLLPFVARPRTSSPSPPAGTAQLTAFLEKFPGDAHCFRYPGVGYDWIGPPRLGMDNGCQGHLAAITLVPDAAANSALIRLAVTSGQRPDLTLIPTDREDVTSVSELMQTCWSQKPEERPPFNDSADRLRHVKDRFSREEIRQAIIAVEKMKVHSFTSESFV
ncbi:RIPK2 [Branchiostoma lanceolatum]|uniref:RIPK2 protein n=1 Tax=Branchiostoma lanceolatum TaxID=7740 RepID=A0A8J9ZCV5_BRALA|nr:RIPK2 [Branchiostoma lanceolatum]